MTSFDKNMRKNKRNTNHPNYRLKKLTSQKEMNKKCYSSIIKILGWFKMLIKQRIKKVLNFSMDFNRGNK